MSSTAPPTEPPGRTARRRRTVSGEEAAIDPRIADRRDTIRRHRRRRIWWRVGALIAAVSLAVGAVALSRSSLLDVDRIVVEGTDRTRPDDVRAGAGIDLGDPMVHVDEAAAAAGVATLPWVDEVRIDRSWPATLRIRVTERDPVAAVERAGEGWLLIDDTGRILTVVDEPGDRLRLVGAGDADQPGRQLEDVEDLLSVAQALSPAVRAWVSAVAREEGEIRLWMEPAGMIRFGDAQQIGAKLAAIETLFDDVDDRCLAVVDVRVPRSPTINRIPDCANPVPAEPELTGSESEDRPGAGAGAATEPPTPSTVPGSPAPSEGSPVSTVPASTVPVGSPPG